MNPRLGLTILIVSVLPPASAFAGEGKPSAKDALPPSAKDALPPSAKDALARSPKSGKGIIVPTPEPSQGRWTFGAGLSWRNIGAIDFRTGISRLTIPRLYQPSNTPVPGIGPATGPADRLYDNGFIRPDARAIPRTTDYGYQTLDQIQGNTLVFNATGGEREDVDRATGAAETAWNEDRDWAVAPYLKLSYQNDLGDGWSVGPAIHLSFAEINGSRRGLNTILGREQRDTFDIAATDFYDITGLDLPRQVPYTGAPNIVAPLVPNGPTAGSRLLTDTLRATDVVVWNDSIAESLEVDAWSISIGADAVYQYDERFYASVGAGVALNMASWDAMRTDQLFQQINNGPPEVISSSSESDLGSSVLWGFYLQAAGGYSLNEDFSLELSLRYDHTEELSGEVGNSSFDVDLSGFSVGLGANYSF